MLKRLAAEAIGTAILMATATGCAAMTATLVAGPALSLAICALCAGAALFVAITIFTPVSGGHLNPRSRWPSCCAATSRPERPACTSPPRPPGPSAGRPSRMPCSAFR